MLKPLIFRKLEQMSLHVLQFTQLYLIKLISLRMLELTLPTAINITLHTVKTDMPTFQNTSLYVRTQSYYISDLI